MDFFTAIKFLTIFPVLPHKQLKVEKLGESLPYFPLVGLILGGILYGLYYGFSFILPFSVVSALLIAILALMTGAHHIDGLIDTFDGMVKGKSRKQRLAIMSDSRVGTFGIVAAILLFLLKYTSLLSSPAILPALLLMPTLSRWSMVTSLFFFPYAKDDGTGIPFKQGAAWYSLATATIIAMIIAYLLLNWWGLVLMASLWLIISGIAFCFRSLFGGLTGDNYGAINELAEVLILVLIIILV